MKLSPRQFPWKTGPVTAVFDALPAGSTRYVGGCVRNAVLGEAVGDVDLATQLEPDAVITALEAAGIKTVPTGVDHGTVTAVVDGTPFEITSLRRDVETDGRRAVVSYTQDWAEDARRRDFTMNALYMSPQGDVSDPTGQGMEDAKARRLRFVGEAESRIREDYLRILRFFRFMAWYARDASVDADALRACRENAQGLKTLSSERVWAEMKKLLGAPDPSRAVRVMQQQGILEVILPEASNAEGLALYTALERREGLKPDPIRRLMSMMARLPLPALTLTKRLKMSKAEATRIRDWAETNAPLDGLLDSPKDQPRLAAIYELGKDTLIDRAVLRAAGEPDAIRSSYWMALVDLAMAWTPPKFPVSGKDLKAAGIAPGEGMGRRLKALEALWVRSGFTADRAKLMMALSLMGED